MKQQANPADYIPRARSGPAAEYEGEWMPSWWRRLRWRAGAFLIGIARVLDLAGRISTAEFYADDEEALRSDWEAVGGDLSMAMAEIEREIEEVKR